MPDGPCPGKCNYAWRSARASFDEALAAYDPLDATQSRPIPPQIIAVPGNPWCGGCQATIRRQLAEIGTLAAHLSAGADGFTPATLGDRVTGTPGRRSPSPAADTILELYSVLFGWECAWWEIRFGRDGPPDRRGFLADKLTDCIVWLIDHFGGMICHGDTPDRAGIGRPFGEEIRDWHKSLVGRTKAGTRVRPMPLRCPGHGCGELSLTWREGDEYVRCGNRICGAALTRTEYDTYASAFARLPAAS